MWRTLSSLTPPETQVPCITAGIWPLTSMEEMSESKKIYDRIYAIVRQIPAGRVTTYGDVARLADLRGQARLVGYALHALPPHSNVPWHRVINAKGGISTGHARMGAELEQRFRLEAEGIEFNTSGRTSLRQFQWRQKHGV